MGSALSKSERETIASNIIVLSQWSNNTWIDFTWEEYEKLCKHNVTAAEKGILDDFVNLGYLSKQGEKYRVENFFIFKLCGFIKPKK